MKKKSFQFMVLLTAISSGLAISTVAVNNIIDKLSKNSEQKFNSSELNPQTPSFTWTISPTKSNTSTPTFTLTFTPTYTRTNPFTLTPSNTSTFTLTPTITLTSTKTIKPTETRWPTATENLSTTATRWPTATESPYTPAPGGNCHPSYPGNCFPYPPDLDCKDIWQRNFPVLPPDPHGFDRDGDGIGCET